MSQTRVVERIKKKKFNNFFPDNRAVFEIMWKNAAELERPKMKIKQGACALHTA